MPLRFAFAFALLSLVSWSGFAQEVTPLCNPAVTGPVIVDDHDQVIEGGLKAEPPLIDTKGFGFAWPDTQMGVIKVTGGYQFFTSDGAFHPRQFWNGEWVGNNNYGSVVTTLGTLDNPLGTTAPRDVTISPNPDPAVNPNYAAYGYIGGGPVFQVPAGKVGAGNLLVGYHAELPYNTLYAVHGLAASWDNGLHWTDLGEVVRPNQSYAPNLNGFDEIGDGPLVLSPDGQYFYFYFPDWPAGTATTTKVSVARARVESVLQAAFGSPQPHTVPFEKFYMGNWHLQPGIGGASTDLNPTAQYQGYLDVHFNSDLHRYVMITSDDSNFGYYESPDGLHWSNTIFLGTFANPGNGTGTIAPYPTSVGWGDDPSILGKSFYIYYTFLHIENGGEPRKGNSLRRLTLTC
ncbi:MAG TPA: hypothetical protein VND65_00245, partial [Candidatus Binatia bacterium]|nr:hypothetical protein [Candidatus Binatia bacterium]